MLNALSHLMHQQFIIKKLGTESVVIAAAHGMSFAAMLACRVSESVSGGSVQSRVPQALCVAGCCLAAGALVTDFELMGVQERVAQPRVGVHPAPT